MRQLLTVALLFCLAACATPMQTGSQCVVPEGFLADAQTFRWRGETAIQLNDRTGYISPIVERGLVNAVIAEIASKGFTYAGDSDADFEVALVMRTRRELVSITIDESPCTAADCWERVDPGSSTRMDMRTVGFLAADVYYEGEPIWRGWVERNLYPEDRDNPEGVVSQAVPALFETFPP